MTFVEVQLGSGGVLCVAQGTAQSHGKEGEDQRVSAHQLHLGLFNLFSFCRRDVAKWPPQRKSQTKDSLQYYKLFQKHTAKHGPRHPRVWCGRTWVYYIKSNH